jgi:gliding motility-associated-like protein
MRIRHILIVFILLAITTHAQTWKWARQATGDAQEDNYGIAIDKNGNSYITGEWSYCNSNADTAVFCGYTLQYPDKDFLVKYDPSGNVLWARSAHGGVNFGWVQGFGVATDNSNNVYEIGLLSDTTYFGTHLVVTPNGGYFLVKYDANGNVKWPILIGGIPNAVATDSKNNVFVTGTFTGSVTFGTTTLTAAGGSISNIFLTKYDSNGNVLWATAPSPPPSAGEGNQGIGIATDNEGNSYIAGAYGSPNITFGSCILTNPSGILNAFLVKYDPNGNALWARGSSGTVGGGNQACAVAVDRIINVCITGGYLNDSILFGSQTLGPTNGGVFMVKYDSTGDLLWAKGISSPGGHFGSTTGYALATDECNDVYVTGGCSYSISLGALSYSVPSNSADPSFVMELDCAGNPVSGFMLPDGGDDYIGLVLDKADNIILGGDLVDTTGFGNDTLKPFCEEASFIAKCSLGQTECCKNITVSIAGNTSLQAGDTTVLTAFPSNALYLWSNGATTDNIILEPASSISCSVYVIDSMGCQCSSTVDITINENCGNVFIPNAFSPNNDGQNDVLYVRGDCIKTMDFVIYDRWGNKVFESTNTSNGWDGTYKGRPMNTGTFSYYLKATLFDGTEEDKKGNVALVR